jgi:tetratricopeptide (TPR) repeat protein
MPPGRDRCDRCQLKEDFEEGKQLTRSGDFPQALAMFKKVCTFEEAPAEMRSEAFYCCGAIFHKQGQEAKAEAAWRKCLEIDPGHAKRAKLAGLIAQRPKRTWTEQDRLIMEGSEFTRAKPAASPVSSILMTKRTPLIVGSIAILLVLIAGSMAYNRINRYLTFDGRSKRLNYGFRRARWRIAQYFNDHFAAGMPPPAGNRRRRSTGADFQGSG